MIKKLPHNEEHESEKARHIAYLLSISHLEVNKFIHEAKSRFYNYTIEFYEVVGDILETIGFDKVSVTREGDTNNRMDAIIIDKSQSIPIEIKSPREIEYINVKSVRQALENKIVLLSREFYPTKPQTTSLSIGFSYPNDRSGVYELIDDIYETFNIKIGIIDFEDLLKLFYEVMIEKKKINLDPIYNLKGSFND